MKSITMSKMQQVDGGPVVGLECNDGIWTFHFKNKLKIEVHSGWRLFNDSSEIKTLLANRDLENETDPFKVLNTHTQNFKLTVILFAIARDSIELFLHNDNLNQLKIEIMKTSTKSVNWKIVGEDFVDSDQVNLIRDLK